MSNKQCKCRKYTNQFPTDSQKYSIYINEGEMYESVIEIQQSKAKRFRKRYCSTMFFTDLKATHWWVTCNENWRSHRMCSGLEFTNEEERQNHQQQILKINEERKDLIQNRRVPRRRLYDTVLVVDEEKKPEEEGKCGEHPYYMIRCKKIQLPR